jgi:hypothetical protein
VVMSNRLGRIANVTNESWICFRFRRRLASGRHDVISTISIFFNLVLPAVPFTLSADDAGRARLVGAGVFSVCQNEGFGCPLADSF